MKQQYIKPTIKTLAVETALMQDTSNGVAGSGIDNAPTNGGVDTNGSQPVSAKAKRLFGVWDEE